MPVFNAAPFIDEAIQSLLNQSYNDFELIIIDDGSTDNSPEIISQHSDSRIKVVRNSENRGIVFSRNLGLQLAQGNYIAPFDADDIALPEKFIKQISFLEKHREFGMIGSWVRLIDEKNNLLPSRWKLNAPPERIPAIMLFRNYFVQSSVVLRKDAIPEGGYAEGYDIVEDYRMWIDIAQKHKTWNYPEYLLHYRIHPKSITQENKKRLEQRDRLIFTFLLNMMDINPKNKYLNIFLCLKSQQPFLDKTGFDDVQELFYKLIEQNKRLGIYDHRQLIGVIYNRWIKLSVRSRSNWIRAIRANLSTGLHWQNLIKRMNNQSNPG